MLACERLVPLRRNCGRPSRFTQTANLAPDPFFFSLTVFSSPRKYFGWWYGWAVRSRLKPIVEVAKMLKRHLEGLLNFIRHKVTNALTEGFNSKVQHLKYSA